MCIVLVRAVEFARISHGVSVKKSSHVTCFSGSGAWKKMRWALIYFRYLRNETFFPPVEEVSWEFRANIPNFKSFYQLEKMYGEAKKSCEKRKDENVFKPLKVKKLRNRSRKIKWNEIESKPQEKICSLYYLFRYSLEKGSFIIGKFL